MVHFYSLYIMLAMASSFAAPIAQRDGQDFSSHTGNEIIDDATPADIALPPIDAVFAMMAAASSDPSASLSSSPSATSTLPSATAEIIHAGPEDSLPTGAVSPSEQVDPPALLTHKFIFVSVVILSMVALVLAVYAFSYHSNRRHEQRSMKTVQIPPPPVDEKEKGRCCSVVDISRNFPRSKFSVTSSDYPISARASSCDSELSESDCSSDAGSASFRDSSYGRGLMNPALFFGLRSSYMAPSRRHSRNGSAPVFGVPRFDMRREQSGRSRSVSGPRQEWMW